MHAEDRGFQFGDAVYEVCEVRGGRLVDETRHMQRLARSLTELGIPQPMARGRLVARDARDHPAQPRARRPRLSAGVARRRARAISCSRPMTSSRPSCAWRAAYRLPGSRRPPLPASPSRPCPTSRWARCDIKTVMLLPASLAKEAARRRGGQGGLVRRRQRLRHRGRLLERLDRRQGGAAHHPPDRQRHPARRHAHHADRPAEAGGIELVERPFTVEEAKAAREAFITSATNIVMPVVRIDGKPIGNGAPGMLSTQTAGRISFGGGNRGDAEAG